LLAFLKETMPLLLLFGLQKPPGAGLGASVGYAAPARVQDSSSAGELLVP
jgi:hypothetical protein